MKDKELRKILVQAGIVSDDYSFLTKTHKVSDLLNRVERLEKIVAGLMGYSKLEVNCGAFEIIEKKA